MLENDRNDRKKNQDLNQLLSCLSYFLLNIRSICYLFTWHNKRNNSIAKMFKYTWCLKTIIILNKTWKLKHTAVFLMKKMTPQTQIDISLTITDQKSSALKNFLLHCVFFILGCPYPNYEIRHVLGGTRFTRPINLTLWETSRYHSGWDKNLLCVWELRRHDIRMRW